MGMALLIIASHPTQVVQGLPFHYSWAGIHGYSVRCNHLYHHSHQRAPAGRSAHPALFLLSRVEVRPLLLQPAQVIRFPSVTVDGVSQGAISSYTFSNVTANHTISATFSVRTYTITASAGTGGTISPSGSVTVNHGANQTFAITPNTGYSISSVTVDGVSQGAISSYTFSNVTAAHTINATFSAISYTITASAGAGGSISPSGSVSVNHGANRTFTITANTGYTIANVLVDGASVGTVSSYTFSNVIATTQYRQRLRPIATRLPHRRERRHHLSERFGQRQPWSKPDIYDCCQHWLSDFQCHRRWGIPGSNKLIHI